METNPTNVQGIEMKEVVVEQAKSSGSLPKTLLIAGILILLLLIGGVAYLSLSGNLTTAVIPKNVAVTSVPQKTVIDNELTALEKELSSITVEDIEADFTDIDKDLNSL